MSDWKVAKVFRAIFKWLSDKIDIFSVNGVKFETLQSIYTNVTESLNSNQDNSQNNQILTCAQKFMKNLNSKMEDFEYHNQPSSDDESQTDLYDISGRKAASQQKEQLMKSQQMQESAKSSTMKNNFMNVQENEFEERKQTQEDFWNEKEEEEESTHPLKGNFMESFDEIAKSKSKFQISQNLNFIRLIL